MRLVPGLLLTAGLLLIGGGLWLLVSDAPAENLARVAALPRVAVADVARRAAGDALLVEGRLVAKAAPGPRDFVAFHRESFLRVESSGASKGRPVWQRLDTVRPAIAIEGAGATVDVANRDYLLDTWPHQEQTDAVPYNSSIVDRTERFLGFKAGDVVTIDGRVVSGGAAESKQIQAAVLFGGGADAYLASVRGGQTVFLVVGGVFAFFGTLLTIVGGLWLRASRPGATSRKA